MPGSSSTGSTHHDHCGQELGLTRSFFATDRVDERSPVYGLSFAGSFTLPITSRLGVQAELILVRKGATFSANAHPNYLTYVEIPVLARVSLPSGTALKPFVAFGPYVSRLIHCTSFVITVQPTADTRDVASINYACYAGRIPRIDVGAIAAAGARVPLGRWLAAVADVRYEWGARNVVEGASGPIRNQTLGISLGLSFPLRGEPDHR